MSEKGPRISQAETLCIRTTKVYDWCYSNGTNTFVITDLVFPEDTSVVAGMECSITDFSCAEISRSQAGGGIAMVTLRKQASFELTFVDAAGLPVPVTIGGVEVDTQTRTRFYDEFIQICAPTGTDVTCDITDSGCSSTLTIVSGTPAVSVDIYVCQSVRSEADVSVCVDIVDFCAPDLCSPVARQQDPPSCPPTLFPPQCSTADPRYTPPCAGT